MTGRDYQVCECEHEAHTEYGKRTPNGNPGHAAGVEYAPSYMRDAKTIFGTFRVCKDCANDCYHPDTLRELGLTRESA